MKGRKTKECNCKAAKYSYPVRKKKGITMQCCTYCGSRIIKEDKKREMEW